MKTTAAPFPRPLLVNLARKFGGAEVRVLELARAFQSDGCLIACLDSSPLALKAGAEGLACHPLSHSKMDLRIPARLARLIRWNGFGLVDVHNIQSYFWAYPLLIAAPDRPVFTATVHSSVRAEQKNRLKGWLNHFVASVALPRFDQVITVSGYLCTELERDGVDRSRIRRVPNGVQIGPPEPGAREGVRQEFGIEPSAPLIGVVGRLEPAKGIDILLLALADLLPNWPTLRCLLAGSGSLSASLAAMARRLGLEKQVVFAGFRGDVTRLLSALDVFVLPSRTEGMPIALLEAGSAGLPCVASRVGGVPEILVDGQSGLLVPAEDPAQLAMAVDCLLRDRSLARQLGQAAAETVGAAFTTQRMVAGTRAAYSAALAGREGSRR